MMIVANNTRLTHNMADSIHYNRDASTHERHPQETPSATIPEPGQAEPDGDRRRDDLDEVLGL